MTSLTCRRPRKALEGGDVIVAAAAAIVAVVGIAALLGPEVFGLNPSHQNLLAIYSGPSEKAWLGTDGLGRDVLARVIEGARSAFIGPLIVAFGTAAFAALLGLLAGYFGGSLDWWIGKWIEFMIAVPTLLKVIVIVGIAGGGPVLAWGLLILFSAPYDARVIRGAVLQQRARPYVEAARVTGLSDVRIMFGHILPAVVPQLMVLTFMNFSWALVKLSSLSFLGIGGSPGDADWGRMLAENRTYVGVNPWAAVAPGLALALISAAMSLIGDRLNERFNDTGRDE